MTAAWARSRSVGNVRPLPPVAAAGGPDARLLHDHRVGEELLRVSLLPRLPGPVAEARYADNHHRQSDPPKVAFPLGDEVLHLARQRAQVVLFQTLPFGSFHGLL